MRLCSSSINFLYYLELYCLLQWFQFIVQCKVLECHTFLVISKVAEERII